MTRYAPSRNYGRAAIAALVMAGVCGWLAATWAASIIPCILFLISSTALFLLASRPVIEIHPRQLRIGGRVIPWAGISAVDLSGWTSPLIVRLTLVDETRVHIVYPADLDSALSLLRQLRRMSHSALIDGVPYDEFWGEDEQSPPAENSAKPPRYPLLREDDEAEVERLFQRLKSVGHLDSKSNDEN
jgi:hypothetical protein